MLTNCCAAIASAVAADERLYLCWVIGERLCESLTVRSVYIGLLLPVARNFIFTVGRARDAAIVRRVSGGALQFVHRSCDRLALRLAIVSLWGDSNAFE